MDFSRTELARDHQIFLSGYWSSISLIQIAGSCEVCSFGSPQGTLEWWVSVSFFPPSGEYCHWFLSAYTLLSSKFPKALKNIWLKEFPTVIYTINLTGFIIQQVFFFFNSFYLMSTTSDHLLIQGCCPEDGGQLPSQPPRCA